jgi:hypothetical protein
MSRGASLTIFVLQVHLTPAPYRAKIWTDNCREQDLSCPAGNIAFELERDIPHLDNGVIACQRPPAAASH